MDEKYFASEDDRIIDFDSFDEALNLNTSGSKYTQHMDKYYSDEQ